MSGQTGILLALLLPLAAAGLAILFGGRPNLREAAAVLAGGALAVTVFGLIEVVRSGASAEVRLFEIFPGVDMAFRAEPLGLLFALVASVLWPITTVYAAGYMRGHHEENQTRFFTFFAIAIFAAMGAAFAANVLTLFFFYELMTLATYPLVTHHGDDRARRGGRTYLGILLFTSVAFLLLAVLWTWSAAGTLEFTPGGILRGKVEGTALVVLLGLYAFGAGKAALMPFHRWLPAAMVAPTPVSALLHAVAVVKVGVFTVLKVVVYVFGTDLLTETGASDWLTWAAGFTLVCGSLVALTRMNLKERLAYSTVSQLAYVVLGAALANRLGIIGGGLHIAMHAVGKITLFFCAGAIYVAAHKTEVSELRGLGRRMPITMGAFFVGSLSIIGLPPCGGTWSKLWLAGGAAETGHLVLLGALMLSSLLNIAYLLPIPLRGFFSAPPEGEPRGYAEAPLACLVPLAVTALGSVALFFLAEPLVALLEPLFPSTGGSMR